MISKRDQSKDIQDLMEKGEEYLIGLFLFYCAYPVDTDRVQMYCDALHTAAGDLELKLLQGRLTADFYFAKLLGDYVSISIMCDPV